MSLHDGTPRRPYDGPRDAHGHRPTSSWNWKLFAGIILVMAVLVMLTSWLQSGQERDVTNAPANTPPSTQQPDTTPPVNPKPAR